eukprot:gene131-210_t
MFMGIYVAVVATIFSASLLSLKSVNFPKDHIWKLASVAYNSSDEEPLHGKVCIVTGATSGIGQAVAEELYEMGATVIITSRSFVKNNKAMQIIRSMCPQSNGSLSQMVLDTSDLASVRSFADMIKKKYKRIHFLVNNAGIHYSSYQGLTFSSPQGFDLAFATNYLGHFLLTELLLPLLLEAKDEGARIVNVASGLSIHSDGSSLWPPSTTSAPVTSSQENWPLAARSDINTSQHKADAYINNKLAQVLHAKELQRRLNKHITSSSISSSDDENSSNNNNNTCKNGNILILSVCPNFVQTNILPRTLIGSIIRLLAFPVEASTLAPLYALFSPDLSGGEFIFGSIEPTSPFGPFIHNIIDIAARYGMRDVVQFTHGAYSLFSQRLRYGISIPKESPRSLNIRLASALYDWSLEAPGFPHFKTKHFDLEKVPNLKKDISKLLVVWKLIGQYKRPLVFAFGNQILR